MSKIVCGWVLGVTFFLAACGEESAAPTGTPPIGMVTSTPTPTANPAPTGGATGNEPLFPNSIVSNDLAFLQLSDVSVEYCIADGGIGTREMPGSPTGMLVESGVHILPSHFDDGTTVEIWASPAFASSDEAKEEAEEIVERLALLPSFMRETLRHVVLHTGDGGAFAEDSGNFFVVYQDNMRFRRSENDMEETLFHESVHATMDVEFRYNDPRWQDAQQDDPGFVTEYARDRTSEDLAESAIFAFVDMYHPGRLPQDVTDRIYQIMPARLAYLQTVFPDSANYFVDYRSATSCS